MIGYNRVDKRPIIPQDAGAWKVGALAFPHPLILIFRICQMLLKVTIYYYNIIALYIITNARSPGKTKGRKNL